MAIDLGVSYLAVVVGAVAAFIIGAVWYSPALFGKQWAASYGMTVDQIRPEPPGFVVAAIVGLVNSWVVAVFALNLRTATIGDALALGVLIWLGFFATALAGDTIFRKASWSVWAINAVHALIVQVVLAAIVTLLR